MSDNRGSDFIKRDYDISDEVLKKVYCLDELIQVLPYDVIKTKYFGTSSTKEKDAPDFDEDAAEEKGTPIRRKTTELKRTFADDECPFDGKFGIAIDKIPQCSKECPDDKYQLCAKEADKIEEEKKAEAKKSGGIRRRS